RLPMLLVIMIRPEHSLIMITNNIGNRVVLFSSEFLKGLNHYSVAFNDSFENIHRNTFSDHSEKMSVIIHLEKVKNIAIENEFDVIVCITSSCIIVKKFDKFLVEIEFFEGIELPILQCASETEMKVTDHQFNFLRKIHERP